MCYSSLELLSCVWFFILCKLSPQMNIWRSFYEKTPKLWWQPYWNPIWLPPGGSDFRGSTSKINCMGLYYVCTKFGAFLKNVMIIGLSRLTRIEVCCDKIPTYRWPFSWREDRVKSSICSKKLNENKLKQKYKWAVHLYWSH